MKPIDMREADFKRELADLKYPESLKTEFFEYWTEPNKSGTRMRFELEKTWHTGRRLARWANSGFKKEAAKTPVNVVKMKAETEIEKLDELLEKYKLHPTSVPFDEFGKWYEYLKGERMLRKFTQGDVNMIVAAYGDDREKCRCAAVQMTFDGFVNNLLTFGGILEIRKKLA